MNSFRVQSSNTIAGDRLPLDGKPHPIEVKAKGPGLYYFEFDDQASSPREAIEETLHRIGPELYVRFDHPDSEYGEEFSHYLVEVAGDAEFRHSQ